MSTKNAQTVSYSPEAFLADIGAKADEIAKSLGTTRDTVMSAIKNLKVPAAPSVDDLKEMFETLSAPVEEGKGSIWDAVKGAYKTTNYYGSLPAYGIGYGLGYGVKTVINPVADIVSCVPLIGAVVDGFGDGCNKASNHWEFTKDKVKEITTSKED